MADSIRVLLEHLTQLELNNQEFTKDAKVPQLKSSLREVKADLEDASGKYNKDEAFEQWEKQVRDVVYDIEDTIDTCLIEAYATKTRKRIKNLTKNLVKHKKIRRAAVFAEEVKHLTEMVIPRVNMFKPDEFSPKDATDTDVDDDARKIRQQRSTHIVGFEAEAEFFVDLLTRESDKLEICSVIGMPGLGKSTFAWKLFQDSTIGLEFPALIWVNVSENFNVREVLLDIRSKFTPLKPEAGVTESDLITSVKDYLEDTKFLMVLDDIWTIKAWKLLKAFLPTNNKWGRVLITTTNTDVGNNAATRLAYNMRFLTAKESWELLQYMVFGQLDCVHRELVGVGKDITTYCRGLPLSIVIIGGILKEKSHDNISRMKNDWDAVSKSVKSYLVKGGAKGVLGSIISLRYKNLPYELRNCFLYLGVFPEDANIPVKKLIRLWIAEGFIQKSRQKTLEEVAQNNLEELINQNLVMVRVAKLSGEPKICHVHDSIREICKSEGEKINLFQKINISGRSREDDIAEFRRICIHSNIHNFFSREQKPLKARSFLCFNESPLTIEPKEVACLANTFSLLRVYEAENIKFQQFPKQFLKQLDHLRYLTLSVHDVAFKILPEIIMDLWNLQTLKVDTPSEILEVKEDMSKMRQLRHFKTRASIILRKIGDGGGKELQTLGRLSPESCTNEFSQKVCSLLTLGIQGDLRNLGNAECLRNLNSLHKLKLVHQVSRGGAADNPWRSLPDSLGFPPKLKFLVLSGTRLDWANMSIFSTMGSLEVLKLKESAFQGNTWDASGSGFPKLICLHIDRADLKLWKVSNDHFPGLQLLYINNCEKLLGIPSTLGKSLEVLSLEHVSVDAVQSAKEIVKDQEKLKRVVRLEIAAADRLPYSSLK